MFSVYHEEVAKQESDVPFVTHFMAVELTFSPFMLQLMSQTCSTQAHTREVGEK